MLVLAVGNLSELSSAESIQEVTVNLQGLASVLPRGNEARQSGQGTGTSSHEKRNDSPLGCGCRLLSYSAAHSSKCFVVTQFLSPIFFTSLVLKLFFFCLPCSQQQTVVFPFYFSPLLLNSLQLLICSSEYKIYRKVGKFTA